MIRYSNLARLASQARYIQDHRKPIVERKNIMKSRK